MSRSDIKIAEAPRNDRPADKFRCGRLCHGDAMGSCSRGPRPNGACGSDTDPCKPVRTFRAFRRRMIMILVVLAILSAGVWMSIDTSGFLKPGDLSHAHAVIFAGQGGINQCTACHPSAALSAVAWFGKEDVFHNRLSQTDSCVTCHHVKMPADVARSPHNLSTERLSEIRKAWAELALSGNAGDTIWNSDDYPAVSVALNGKTEHSFDSIECASCHREHGGVNAIMTAMSNAQCQSCHSRTFESFRDGHPDWRQWPHTGAKVIAFDHATHQKLHFPKASPKSSIGTEHDPVDSAVSASDLISHSSVAMGRAFDCRTCHPGTAVNEGAAVGLASIDGRRDSEPLRTVSFETACADCHSAGLRELAIQRLDLFALPTMPSSTTAQLGQWPAAATGFFDGEVGPLVRWLVSEEAAAAQAIARLPGEASITQIDPSQGQQVQAAVVAARAIRRAMDQFGTRGSNLLAGRQNRRAAEAMRQVLRTVPPQLIADAQRQWFDSDAAVSAILPLEYQSSLPVSARPFFGDSQRLAQSPTRPAIANDDLLGDDDPLSDDLVLERPPGVDDDDILSGDPLSGDPLSPPETKNALTSRSAQRFDPSAALPDGGWYRDDLRLAISYRGSGHADPVLKAVVEMAASLPADDPVRRGLLGVTAVSSCMQCHVGVLHPSGPIWKTPVGRQAPKALTKFSHRPHFNLPQLSDCSHCHLTHSDSATVEEMVRLKSIPGYDPAASHGFISLGKSACISCHTQGAAGDNCTQCHHYHSHK